MLELPKSLRTVSELSSAFSSLADDSRYILSNLEPIYFGGLAFLVLLTATSCISRTKHKDSPGLSKSLQALSSILTPTCTSWPKDYTGFLVHTTCPKSKTITLPISRLFGEICLGNIEIRDFSDLPCLLKGQIRTYGWNVSLSVDLSMKSAVLRWIAAPQPVATKV